MASSGLLDHAKSAFRDLYADLPEIQGIIIATSDGLPLAAELKDGASSDRLAALVATALSIGKRMMPSIGMSTVTEFSITTGEGRLFIYAIGDSAALCILTPKTVNLGMVLLKAGDVSKKLATVLAN